jgi:hypothetical protein
MIFVYAVKKSEDPPHSMVSARSDVSQQSGWSDDESLFSSARDKANKPSLVKLQQKTETMESAQTSHAKQASHINGMWHWLKCNLVPFIPMMDDIISNVSPGYGTFL